MSADGLRGRSTAHGPSLDRHPLLADDTISATELRRMTDADWARVMAGDAATIARHVRSAAEHGFKTAQVTWGQMLLDGRGVVRDPVAAHRWFLRAAGLGSPDGVNMVGRCHELGWGVPVNHAEAAVWYRRAAAKGSAWGAYNLGCMLLYGDGERDRAAALGWFRRSAEGGNAKAMGMVARCLDEGWGTGIDPQAAARWYLRAAEQGDCWARYNLAMLNIEAGDMTGAARWLRRSLEVGSPNFLRAVAEELSRHEDPDLRAIGRDALDRSGEAWPDGTKTAPAPGVWSGMKRLAHRLSPNRTPG